MDRKVLKINSAANTKGQLCPRIYDLVKNCANFCESWELRYHQQRLLLQLLLTSSPVDFVSMDILKPLPKTSKQKSSVHRSNWQVLETYICGTSIQNDSLACYSDSFRQMDYALWHPQLAFDRKQTTVHEKIVQDYLQLLICQKLRQGHITQESANWTMKQNNSRTIAFIRRRTSIKLGFILPAALYVYNR